MEIDMLFEREDYKEQCQRNDKRGEAETLCERRRGNKRNDQKQDLEEMIKSKIYSIQTANSLTWLDGVDI